VRVARPSEISVHDGLSYSLWLPDAPRAGVVILHGAGSCKESHHDFARLLVSSGLAALAFDQRGHGESSGRLGAGVLEDIAAMASVLTSAIGSSAALAVRGSSMGGYLAILAGPVIDARAIVAICPASAQGLRRGLASGAFTFDADADGLDRFLETHDLHDAVDALEIPLLILHAEGDEQVPVEHSRELAERMRSERSRLVTLPGGHHRSIQHDPEMQALSLRFIQRVLAG
jgi:alpha-beta hydrolase superfamily lysophospholipase